MFLLNLIDPFTKLTGLEWLQGINIWSIIVRLVISVLIGGIIGLERAFKHRAAGFRTHILVCVGATVAMLTNEYINTVTGTGDGARLGAQVISGIGFLGAGTIMFTSRNQVKGLTTAAGLWACACLGLAIGVGFYTLAVIASIIVIGVFSLLPTIEKGMTLKSKRFTIHIEFTCRENLREFITVARDLEFKVLSVEYNPAYSHSGLSVYTIELRVLNNKKIPHTNYIEEFQKYSYVNFVEEIL
jgi:putative Mg2+ transporter-C (MgtC) family protein